MSYGSSPLLIDAAGGVVRLTLNRPERRNALSRALLGELETALTRIAADATARVVVIAGAGEAFCAGHDLTEMVGCSEAEYRDLFGACARVSLALRHLPQPVIARVHALATAAGCQLAASCDLIVASTAAKFATPGAKIGLFSTTPMVPLVRALPPKVAMEMLLTGAPLSAERAYALGLVNRVVAAERLDAEIAAVCEALLQVSPAAIKSGKAAFYEQVSLAEEAAYDRALEIITADALAPDAREGIAAFLQKRRPVWGGKPASPPQTD